MDTHTNRHHHIGGIILLAAAITAATSQQLLTTGAHAQPNAPTYDGYNGAKLSIQPEAAQKLYDSQYYTNLPNIAPCVLTGQLQLSGGDDVNPNPSNPYAKQRQASINMGAPTPHSYTPEADDPGSLLILNSTLLKGCTDRLIFSPIYSGVPSKLAHDVVHGKALFKAASTLDERSGSLTGNYNNVRAKGLMVPIDGVWDFMLGGGAITIPASSSSSSSTTSAISSSLGECVNKLSGLVTWGGPNAIPNPPLAALHDLLVRSFKGSFSPTAIRDWVIKEQIEEKTKRANSVPEGPSTGSLIDRSPITLVLMTGDGIVADAVGNHGNNKQKPPYMAASGDQVPNPSATNADFLSLMNTPLLSAVEAAEKQLSPNTTIPLKTVADLILLTNTLSVPLAEVFVSTCVRAQIRFNSELYSTAYNDIPISVIAGMVSGDDTIVGIKAYAAAAANVILTNTSLFPTANLTAARKIGKFLASVTFPSGISKASSRVHDHLQYEHYYTLGPASVVSGAAATVLDTTSAAYDAFSPSSVHQLTHSTLSSIFEHDGYLRRSSSSSSSKDASSGYNYYNAQAYADAFADEAAQWHTVKARAVFNGMQVYGRVPNTNSPQLSSPAVATLQKGPAALRPAYEYQSKAPMRLSNEAPLVRLNLHQLDDRGGELLEATSSSSSSSSRRAMRVASEADEQRMATGIVGDVQPSTTASPSPASIANTVTDAYDTLREQLGLMTGIPTSSSRRNGDGLRIDTRGPQRNPYEHARDFPLSQKGNAEQLSSFDGGDEDTTVPTKAARATFAGAAITDKTSSSSSAKAGPTPTSWANFFTAPICLDEDAGRSTCSPIGGLNVWGTTTMPPKGLFEESTTNSTNDPTPNPPHHPRFAPAGSIAVMVNSATTSAIFHDLTPAATTAAADTAALLLVVDTISKSLLPTILYNGSLAREVLGLSPASETNASTTTAEEDAMVLSALGQVYFFFFVGDDGAGFSGSGRMIKEATAFKCLQKPDSPTENDGLDCNFPFYWHTNFTKTIQMSNFTHFVAVDGLLDAHWQVGDSIAATEAAVEEAVVSNSNDSTNNNKEISVEAADSFTFYVYTDATLDSASPAQQLANKVINDQLVSTPIFRNWAATHMSVSASSSTTAPTTMNVTLTQNTTILITNATGGSSVNNNGAAPASYLMINVSYSNITDGRASSSYVSLASTVPPSSLWSFMLAAYGDVGNEDAIAATADDGSLVGRRVVPAAWKERSFTLISSIRPVTSASNNGGVSLTPANTDTLRTSRRVSMGTDTYAAVMAGSLLTTAGLNVTSKASPTTTSTAHPLRAPQNTHARMHIRRAAIHHMLSAAADTVANLLVGLVLEGSLKPLADASAQPQRASAAVAVALNQLRQSTIRANNDNNYQQGNANSAIVYTDAAEAHRLYYCVAGNTNCAYFQADNYALAKVSAADGQPLLPPTAALNTDINAPNYYNGVFSFYHNIPAQSLIVEAYLQDRLKSSYNQRIGAGMMQISEKGTTTSNGVPCNPSKPLNEAGWACPSRFQRCMADTPMTSTAPNTIYTIYNYSCYSMTTFYSHAFAPATMYNPKKPTFASYAADWSFINGWWGGLYGGVSNDTSTYVNPSSSASSTVHAFITKEQLAGLFYGLRIEVESYWSAGGTRDIGARIGMATSPAMLYSAFGGGIGALVVVIFVAVLYTCVIEPRVYSRAEGEAREMAAMARRGHGATETRNFVPLHDSDDLMGGPSSTANGTTTIPSTDSAEAINRNSHRPGEIRYA